MTDNPKGHATTIWPFYVGGEPHSVHQHVEHPPAEDFYHSVEPASFIYWTALEAEAAEQAPDMKADPPLLRIEKEQAVPLAAIRFRAYYLNLMETFFAHFFANVQAPSHPAAWLYLYRSKVLQKLVAKLAKYPWESSPTTRVLGRPRDFVGWLFRAEREMDTVEREAEIDAIIDIVTRLAGEFTDNGTRLEHNAIKHGTRAHSAAWTLGVSRSDHPEKRAVIAAKYGSHFGFANNISTNQHAWRDRHQGWDLSRDIRLANTMSKLLHNLIQVRRGSPEGEQPIRFTFANADLEALFASEAVVRHFEAGHDGLSEEKHTSRDDILKMAEEDQASFERWLFREGDGVET